MLQVYLHLVWATWDRLPLIRPEWEDALYPMLLHQCKQLHCPPLALNGIQDHLHLLLRLAPTVTIANLAKQLKGSSSRFINSKLAEPSSPFKWQGSYSAFSVTPSQLSPVANYIKQQKKHHEHNTLSPHWELPELDNTSGNLPK